MHHLKLVKKEMLALSQETDKKYLSKNKLAILTKPFRNLFSKKTKTFL